MDGKSRQADDKSCGERNEKRAFLFGGKSRKIQLVISFPRRHNDFRSSTRERLPVMLGERRVARHRCQAGIEAAKGKAYCDRQGIVTNVSFGNHPPTTAWRVELEAAE